MPMPLSRPHPWAIACLLACLSMAASAQERDRWTLHARDDVPLQVIEYGPGENGRAPVVVLHGGPGGEHSALLPLVMPLAASERLVLFDQRGSLRSPAPPDAIEFDAMVEDIERLRAQLRAPRIALLAHSMGSLLAYAYAERYPRHVERLLLVAPMFPLPPGDAGGAPGLYTALRLPAPDEAEARAAQERKQARAGGGGGGARPHGPVQRAA